MSFATDDLREEILEEFCCLTYLLDDEYPLQPDCESAYTVIEPERGKNYYNEHKNMFIEYRKRNIEDIRKKDRERKKNDRMYLKITNPALLSERDKIKKQKAKLNAQIRSKLNKLH